MLQNPILRQFTFFPQPKLNPQPWQVLGRNISLIIAMCFQAFMASFAMAMSGGRLAVSSPPNEYHKLQTLTDIGLEQSGLVRSPSTASLFRKT
jgi:hypothetical protein